MWIYEVSGWPAFHWDKAGLSQRLAAVRHRQGRLIGRMESLGFELRREAGLQILTRDVVTSSAIEGEIMDRADVRSSIARHLGIELAGRPTRDRRVEGMVEMLLDATGRFDEPLTDERLFGWHAALFPTGRSGMQPITVGGWRTTKSGPMQVVSGAFGKEKVHFVAPGAKGLGQEIQKFLEWFDGKGEPDPLLRAGIAHLWFVTLHPFEDGNGRIGRAIADMALARADGLRERFYSLSGQLEAERREYYDQLEHAQRGGLDITDWLNWFLGSLDRSFDSAERTLVNVLFKAKVWNSLNQKPVNERQREIVNLMLDEGFQGYMNTSKYAKVAKCSTDTALRDIRELEKWEVLLQNPGGGRSTSYRLTPSSDFP